LKNFIVLNAETLENEKDSKVLIQLIFGSVKFINSTHVYEQDSLVDSFISSVVFESSIISSLNLTRNSIRIISSIFEFSKMDVSKINNPLKNQFIDISSESQVKMSNVEYKDSNSILLSLKSSKASVSNMTIDNVKEANHLVELYDAFNVTISNFTSTNSSSSAENLIIVRKSKNIIMKDFRFESVKIPLFAIEDSHFTEISDFLISHSRMPFEIKNSKIESFKRCGFMHNEGGIQGGVLNLHNSDVTIENSDFINNTAENGGAIYFDCNSLAL
jgi:hypothetical protein